MFDTQETAPSITTTLTSSDGLSLFFRQWPEETDDLRGVVLIVHGYGEHGERYEETARRLAGSGFRVGCGDLRGMGKSGGTRGYVQDFSDYLTDIDVFAQMLAGNAPPSVPFIVYGHSMGGLVALLWAAKSPPGRLGGLVLASPMMNITKPVPAWQVTMATAALKNFPKMRFGTNLPGAMLTRDVAMQRGIDSDPLGLKFTTPGWFFASRQAMTQAAEAAALIECPTLLLLPGSDLVCRGASARKVMESAPHPERNTLEEFPGCRHELHTEIPEVRQALADRVIRWLDGIVAE